MKPESVGVTAVFLGTFKPAHTLINALRDTKSLGAAELAETVLRTVVDGQVAEIRLPWGGLVVGHDRLQATAQLAPYVRASDLLLKYLREIEPGARVRALGINVRCVYRFLDGHARDAVGVRLVPPDAWGDWGREVGESMKLPPTDPLHGGMRSAVLRQGRPGKREGGWIDVKVEAAGSVESPLEVVIEANDHYEVPQVEGTKLSMDDVSGRLLGWLEAEFDASVERSLAIADGIIEGH